MKILVITQKLDKKDSILGFFHTWIEVLAEKCETVTVISLFVGNHNLPKNVRVFSLEKELESSFIRRLYLFLKCIYVNVSHYEKVFVHMNQEYVLLAGFFWKLCGKKIIFWRNHPRGNFFTKLAVLLSDRVMCTSRKSFTNKYKKTEIMPAGVDTNQFYLASEEREKSVIYVGRISSIKNIKKILQIFVEVSKNNYGTKFVFIGDPIEGDKEVKYYEDFLNIVDILSKQGMRIDLIRGVCHEELFNTYKKGRVLINMTEDGSLDKVIFEMMATGGAVVTTNADALEGLYKEYREMLHLSQEDNFLNANKINDLLNLDEESYSKLGKVLREHVVSKHSLRMVIDKIL